MNDLEPFLTRKQINDARAKMLAYRDEMGYAPDDWDGIFECMAVFGEEIMNLLDAIEQITRDEQPQINQNEFVSWLIARLDTAEAEVAALRARIAELETENLALISRIVETDCRDYGRDEYQTQSLANQVLIDRLVAAGRMRHKRNDHKGRPIYEFVHASSEGGP